MTFIVTLAALTGLVLMMVAILNSANVSSHARLNRIDGRRAEIAAEAGIQRAIAVLATKQRHRQHSNRGLVHPWKQWGG